MNRTEKLGVLLLSGGRSSRMGSDKALLPFGKGRLIDVMYQRLSELPGVNVFVSGRDYGYPWIPDTEPFLGPLGGLWSAVNRTDLRVDAWLVVPVDMPMLDGDALQNLILHFQSDSKSDGVRFCGCELPAIFRITPKLFRELRRLMLESVPAQKRSVGSLQLNLVVREIPVSNSLLLTNTNTPVEWTQLCEMRRTT